MLILKEEKIIDNDNIIGNNIRRNRLEKGIGQTELVKQLQLMDVDITRETLVKIESGKQHIKIRQLIEILKVLQTSFEELIDQN
ncbi:helix-turn-helix domain-containing protein [Vagococcus lutrae]|uniref:helix-turn-helix domain-containing protein n=1 Tax=Vagococcus lutrae TaxID=81947 RepID=UPI0005718152|nr:helix-turn-helix transcriptional regulator [Vagococcus lutrae]NKZ27695.1 helix-turn-helix transcriptional regulator [Vagococcus lutrae]